jgi:hypothetical protein
LNACELRRAMRALVQSLLEADILGAEHPAIALVVRFLEKVLHGQERARYARVIKCAAHAPTVREIVRAHIRDHAE